MNMAKVVWTMVGGSFAPGDIIVGASPVGGSVAVLPLHRRRSSDQAPDCSAAPWSPRWNASRSANFWILPDPVSGHSSTQIQ